MIDVIVTSPPYAGSKMFHDRKFAASRWGTKYVTKSGEVRRRHCYTAVKLAIGEEIISVGGIDNLGNISYE